MKNERRDKDDHIYEGLYKIRDITGDDEDNV